MGVERVRHPAPDEVARGLYGCTLVGIRNFRLELKRAGVVALDCDSPTVAAPANFYCVSS
jgi:hypothetical protein